MKKPRATFFVDDNNLWTRQAGQMVRVIRWDRTYQGRPATPVFPHILGNRLILIASNRPVGDFLIYANGDVKEEGSMFPTDPDYTYTLTTAPLPNPSKKKKKE